MSRIALALAAAFASASPAAAQQYWLFNGPGGTTYNNPQGSLSGTYYEHALRRHADQHRWQRERQQQQGGSSPAAASSDPSFRLNNAGGDTIREVYVSSVRDSSWGSDWLGQDVLAPGQRMVIRLPTGQCVNDIRVVWMNGQSEERRQVNTCAITDMPFAR